MRFVFVAAATLSLVRCSAPAPSHGEHVHGPITFAAAVGSERFACDKTFALGMTTTQYRPKDLRFFVSEVEVLDEDGAATPFVLEDDGEWQKDGVALLDFEDGSADCSNGTPATNTTLRGTAETPHAHGLRFTVGVPFALNHQDAAAAEAPFNVTGMFWNWQGGFKFMKIDGVTTGLPMGHNVHVGSTACQPGAEPNTVAACDNPNRFTVTLADFDIESNVVVLDLATLLGGTNLDTNLPMSAPGCMSAPTDTDCTDIFAALGLPFGGNVPAEQRVFKKE